MYMEKSPRNTELKNPPKTSHARAHVSAAHHQTLTKVLLLTTATKIVPIHYRKKSLIINCVIELQNIIILSLINIVVINYSILCVAL